MFLSAIDEKWPDVEKAIHKAVADKLPDVMMKMLSDASDLASSPSSRSPQSTPTPPNAKSKYEKYYITISDRMKDKMYCHVKDKMTSFDGVMDEAVEEHKAELNDLKLEAYADLDHDCAIKLDEFRERTREALDEFIGDVDRTFLDAEANLIDNAPEYQQQLRALASKLDRAIKKSEGYQHSIFECEDKQKVLSKRLDEHQRRMDRLEDKPERTLARLVKSEEQQQAMDMQIKKQQEQIDGLMKQHQWLVEELIKERSKEHRASENTPTAKRGQRARSLPNTAKH